MNAKKPNKLDAYLTQSFQSPYTGAFFALSDASAFDKHLREHAKIQKHRERVTAEKKDRMAFWSTLREQTSSVQDLERRFKELPESLVQHYKQQLSGPGGRARKSALAMGFSEQGKRSYGMRSTTHHCPLGDDTNWGGLDETRASSRLGLTIPASESPNELMHLAEKESGLCTEMNNYVLFAKDWRFVAQNALWLVLNGSIRSRSTLLTGETNKDHAQFLADVENASLQCTGMVYNELKSMVDSLGVDAVAFQRMVEQYRTQASSKPPPTLGLPSNLWDEPGL